MSTDKDLHGLRIALRRMRYVGEACRKVAGRPSRADVERIRRFSSVMGSWHDYAVLVARIEKVSAKLPQRDEDSSRLQDGLKRLKDRFAKRRDAFADAFHRMAGTVR